MNAINTTKTGRPSFRFTLLFLTAAFALSAQSARSDELRLDPLPFWTRAAGWEEPLSPDRILEASLAASGLSPEETEVYIRKYEGIRRSLTREVLSAGEQIDEYATGDALLYWMHNNLLTTYDLHQSRMDLLLDTGRYNCVSSTLLYMVLAKDLGLETYAVETADHSFCRVITPRGAVDVETTTVYGFDPGKKREFSNEFNQTGFTYVPPGNYRLRKNIQDKKMVSLILQNRMAALQRQNRHNDVVGLAVDRHVFLNTSESKMDLAAVFQNLAAEWNDKKEYLKAFDMIVRAADVFDLKEETRLLLYRLGSNHLSVLLNSSRFAEARGFLSQKGEHLEPSRLKELETQVSEMELSREVQTGDPVKTLVKIKDAHGREELSFALWRQWTIFLLQKQALSLSETLGWWDAYRFLKNLPEPEGGFREIRSMGDQMYQNWTALIHNQFVDFVQAKKPAAAKSTLESGLALDPQNRVFNRDLADLAKIFP